MTDAERERYARRLRFPPELERRFQDDYYARTLRPLRGGGIVGIVVMILAAIYQSLISTPTAVGPTLMVLVPPIVLFSFVLLLTLRSDFGRWWQLCISALTCLICIGMFLGQADIVTNQPLNLNVWNRLIQLLHIVIIFMVSLFALSRLQFRWFAFCAWFGLAVSIPVAMWKLGAPFSMALSATLTFPIYPLVFLTVASYTQERLQRGEFLANYLLEAERARSESLLLNVLPAAIAARLKVSEELIADDHPEVTVLFADVCDFTPFAAARPAREVLQFLNDIFSRFDRLAERFALEKIKTVGDCYMAISGAPDARPDHLETMARFALEMQAEARALSAAYGLPVQFRIGLHSGPLVAGVIGSKRFLYDVWGDTVNTASRLESHGEAGKIHISAQVAERLKPHFAVTRRGLMELKGKGRMETYFLEEPAPPQI